MKKIGLVLEGGGLRGIFTQGVIDFFMDKGIKFDYIIGVSAGSCNLLSYVGESRSYYKNCVFNEKGKDSFYGFTQMAYSHKVLDLDKAFVDYAEKYQFDFNKVMNSPIEWEMVVSNIITGKPEYKSERKDLDRLRTIGIASCSLPIITFPVELDDSLYLDGGITDSIPLKRAQEKGCDYVVVVETRRKNHTCHISDVERPIYNRLYGKKYPNFLDAVYARPQMYQDEVDYVDSQVKEGKAFLIRPTLPEVGRLEKDMSKLSLAYYHGYVKAEDSYKDLLEFLNK